MISETAPPKWRSVAHAKVATKIFDSFAIAEDEGVQQESDDGGVLCAKRRGKASAS